MHILGISNNDLAGACLVRSSEVVAAVSEERFTRIKDDRSWPDSSLEFVLKQGGISLDDVDCVAYGWHAGFDAQRHLLLYVDRLVEEAARHPESLCHLRKRVADELHNDRAKRAEFDEFVRMNNLRTAYVDHHDAHALGSFLCSPFDNALVLTCDGRGDFRSLTVTYCDAHEYRLLCQETSIDSLGYFFGRITKLLGFTPNRHEGKITGLAATGVADGPLPLMKRMIDLDSEGRLRSSCGDYYQPSYDGYSDSLVRELSLYDPADVAAAAQQHLENILTAVVARYIKLVPTVNVCLAGGVFANVKLNQRILEVPGIDNIYVLPPMGDGGLPLQAAMVVAHREAGQRPLVPTMALGPQAAISDEELATLLADYPGLHHEVVTDGMRQRLVQALEARQVIGLYRGRMEFGPRALGQRSIIYPTDDVKINDWLNKRMSRTEFMPFAPITAQELAAYCYAGWRPDHVAARFMTITYQCTEFLAETCPAVVHVDNTARPQIVRAEDDPFLHALLLAWYDRSGQAALVNTSYNKHEEPIVSSHNDALDLLRDNVVDLVVIEDLYLVTRKR